MFSWFGVNELSQLKTRNNIHPQFSNLSLELRLKKKIIFFGAI